MKNIIEEPSCSNEHSQNAIRSSNIELLRIIAMFMVVLGHYYVKGGFPDDSLMTTSKLVMQFLGSWSKIAVDIFVIISGYFLVTQKFRWKKICKFFGCTYFWILATLCFVCPKSKCRKIIDNEGSKSYYSVKLVCESLFSFIYCVSVD